jgi:glycosyltransferase involved in cell wall biosynthesis
MKHILIFELSFSGHHSVYLEQIAEGYLNNKNKVTIVILRDFYNHPLILRLKIKYKDKVHIKLIGDAKYHNFFESKLGALAAELAKWYIFRKEFIEVSSIRKVDYIFLPYVDYILFALGLLGSPFKNKPWGGICMLASVHYDYINISHIKINLKYLKKLSFFRLLKNKYLDKFFVIDELLYNFALEYQPKCIRCLKYMMDPAEFKGFTTKYDARKELKIEENLTVILVYGVINARKGVDVLANTLILDEIPKNIHLLIVGEIDNSTQELLNSNSIKQLIFEKRVYFFDKFADDILQQKVFSAADIVWLGYKDHFGMSGVLVLAAKARKVVISCNAGLIGWHTNSKNLGLAVNTEEISEVKMAILKLSEPSKISPYQVKIKDYFDNFTWANAIKNILN